MEKIVKSSDIITRALYCNQFSWEIPHSYLVHTSIINKVKNALHQTVTKTDWEMYDYLLQIGTKRFEMHVFTALNQDQASFIDTLVINSQFSFPWEENPTLFIATEEFHIMEEFNKYFNIEAYILKVEEKLAHSVNGDHPIKVVSFNQSVTEKFDIIKEFKKYRNGNKKGYLFVTNGFPWQQVNLLQRIRLNDNIYSVLPIILRHIGTLNYANDLNIMDLLSLRLAISDVRDDTSNSNVLSYEIDFMIKRILAKLIIT